MGVDPDHHHGGEVRVDLRELNTTSLRRIPEKDVRSGDIRWLVQIDVDLAALEERWGAPEITRDDFAEYYCFAFSPAKGEAFLLLRNRHHAPVPGFIVSVTKELFSREAADKIIEVLAIPGVSGTRVNAEVTEQ
ncbi:hypothetical protein [Streptomyces sp. NPDC088736]|uniref:hypothetical protein n=1 Tax=Streptomyces sp. NPDC088736 TaxID=3365881 RepID=UPI003821CC4E